MHMAWPVQDRRVAAPESPDVPRLTDSMKEALTSRIIPRYPVKRAALLPALHMVQHEFGWISRTAMEDIASFLGISPSEVLDTVSFYEEYRLAPRGKYLLQVCRSLACEICGGREMLDHLKNRLGIEPGQTTADGRFTLVEVECLGACDGAPAMLCNDVLYENLTAEKLDSLLSNLPDDPKSFGDATDAASHA